MILIRIALWKRLTYLPDYYPHVFGNNEELPFPCGRSKQEFPILLNNEVYDGGSVETEPDRVVYEVNEGKNNVIVRYCGVMRHTSGRDFEVCK